MKIGVLALQGAFIEHIHCLQKLGVEAITVRKKDEAARLDGLIIPGGESTTMLKLIRLYHLEEPIKNLAGEGKPVLGTCAGMILMASRISPGSLEPLGLMDMTIRRNAFGRQVDSFETSLRVEGLEGTPFQAIFIRAPLISQVGEKVEVLARLADGTIVAARQANRLALAFHPELGGDLRLHRYFLNMAAAA
jgi:5'-phosphate synthase pdxT subunit